MARLPADKLALLKRAFTVDAMQPTQAAQATGVSYATAKRYYDLWADEIKRTLGAKLLPSLQNSRGWNRLSWLEEETPMTDWFARPVLHVANVEAALRFYVDRLSFTSPWRYDDDGRVRVAQVERQGCALILADHWPEKVGKGLIFISMNAEPDAQIASLHALRAELKAKDVPVREGSWGYRLLVVDDPDGNQLFFNYPNQPASGQQSDR